MPRASSRASHARYIPRVPLYYSSLRTGYDNSAWQTLPPRSSSRYREVVRRAKTPYCSARHYRFGLVPCGLAAPNRRARLMCDLYRWAWALVHGLARGTRGDLREEYSTYLA